MVDQTNRRPRNLGYQALGEFEVLDAVGNGVLLGLSGDGARVRFFAWHDEGLGEKVKRGGDGSLAKDFLFSR